MAREDGVILVDIDLAFTQASGPRLVGDDRFVDAVHLRILGHQLIAKAVADAIRESGVAGTHIRWNLDAYTDPDPETLLDGNPEMPAREKIARQSSCAAAGRSDCVR